VLELEAMKEEKLSEPTEEGNVVAILKCRYLSEGVKLPKLRASVFPFGHVHRNQLKLDVFLQQTGQYPGDGSGHGWPVHLHWRRRHLPIWLSGCEC